MAGPVGAYVVAISAMLFSAASGLTLIYVVSHLDPPEGHAGREDTHERTAA